jgi:ATPase subunit of ABC transporter with duplicated ATPase domains
LAAQQIVPAGALSGGQRSRVAMAAVSFSKPHLLILDESVIHFKDLGSDLHLLVS